MRRCQLAEPTQYMLSHKELVTALVKHQGLTQGIWQLAVNFGFGASNVGENVNGLNPAAIIPVIGIGIQLVTTESNLTIDASTLAKQA
jgi:hypothetical protein